MPTFQRLEPSLTQQAILLGQKTQKSLMLKGLAWAPFRSGDGSKVYRVPLPSNFPQSPLLSPHFLLDSGFTPSV